MSERSVDLPWLLATIFDGTVWLSHAFLLLLASNSFPPLSMSFLFLVIFQMPTPFCLFWTVPPFGNPFLIFTSSLAARSVKLTPPSLHSGVLPVRLAPCCHDSTNPNRTICLFRLRLSRDYSLRLFFLSRYFARSFLQSGAPS